MPVPMIAKKTAPAETEVINSPRSTLSAAPRQTRIGLGQSDGARQRIIILARGEKDERSLYTISPQSRREKNLINGWRLDQYSL